jgi:hypothetical protein
MLRCRSFLDEPAISPAMNLSRLSRRTRWVAATAALGALALPAQAHAYLDPASGSILLQVLLGGVAGAGLLIKLYWQRLIRFVGLRRTDDDSPGS